jgi:hypothetical protein
MNPRPGKVGQLGETEVCDDRICESVKEQFLKLNTRLHKIAYSCLDRRRCTAQQKRVTNVLKIQMLKILMLYRGTARSPAAGFQKRKPKFQPAEDPVGASV